MTDISRAKIRCRNADIERNSDFRLSIVKSRFLDWFSENRSNLSCDTEDTLAVRTVCGDGDIEDIVIETQDRLDIRTRNAVFRKNEKSVITGTREHILGNTDLYTGAEHTVGIVSSKFSLSDRHDTFHSDVILGSGIYLRTDQGERIFSTGSDIICTAADLKRSMLSGIYLAKMQVGAFDRLTGHDFTNDDIADVVADFIFFFYLETAGEEFLLEHIRGNVDIDIIFQPA